MPIADAYPLTRLQGGMLFHSEYSAGESLYHNIDSLQVRTAFRSDPLVRAVQRAAAAHPVLRTSFDLANYKQALQLVHTGVTVPVEIVDQRGLSAQEQDEQFDRWMSAESGHGFDWTRPPLLRVTVHVRANDVFRLSLTSHHAILDGWSVHLLLTELLTHYRELCADPLAPAPVPPATDYAAFVARERAVVDSPEAVEYWRSAMQDVRPARLPRLPKREKRQGTKVPSMESDVPPDIASALRALAAELGVPLRSVLLAAHLAVLRDHVALDEVVTGLVTNVRPPLADAQRVLGLFLNTIPLRLPMRGGRWSVLVREVFEAEQRHLDHVHYPLPSIRAAAGGADLFDTSFNFVHFHTLDSLVSAAGIEVGRWRHFQQTSIPFSVTFGLDALEGGEQLRMLIAYDADEFDSTQVRDMEGRYHAVLAVMAARPESRYDLHPALGREELGRLDAWNRTTVDRSEESVHALVERHAVDTPDAVAVRGGHEQMTYRELNRKANRVAARLIDAGVRTEDRVVVIADRGPATVTAVLGVLKAGGAYVPIDPNTPDARIATVLADSGARIVLAEHGAAAGRLPRGTQYLPFSERDAAPPGAGDDVCPGPPVSPRNAAYVIYTSGSTGRPKGVLIEHRSVVGFTASAGALFEIGPHDRLLQYSSLGFDVSVFEIFGALHAGASLSVVDSDALLDLDGLAAFMRDEQVTLTDLPPAVMALLPAHDLPALRAMFVGGEAFGQELVERWARPDRRFVNGYGPTESTVTMTAQECGVGQSGTPPIGRPLDNHRVRIMDTALRPVPVGVPGELCISGLGLARGYLNAPALTAERFVPDPFPDAPGDRLYRTGDLALFHSDGTLEFLGRLDEQVKIRGNRVEPGETAAVLETHPAVAQAVVTVRKGSSGPLGLVGHVAAEEVSERELRAFLTDRLPAYSVPERIAVMSRLPLTLSGKVDRDALPDVPEAEADPDGGVMSAAPGTPTEELVRALFTDVLEAHHTVGRDEDFFALGGNSLLAAQFIARLRELFHASFSLVDLYAEPTPRAVAAELDRDPRVRADAERLTAALSDLDEPLTETSE